MRPARGATPMWPSRTGRTRWAIRLRLGPPPRGMPPGRRLATGYHYTVERRGRLVHRESSRRRGRRLRPAAVAYALGSGERGYSFLGGRRVRRPVSDRLVRTRAAHDYPQLPRSTSAGHNPECLSCHVARDAPAGSLQPLDPAGPQADRRAVPRPRRPARPPARAAAAASTKTIVPPPPLPRVVTRSVPPPGPTLPQAGHKGDFRPLPLTSSSRSSSRRGPADPIAGRRPGRADARQLLRRSGARPRLHVLPRSTPPPGPAEGSSTTTELPRLPRDQGLPHPRARPPRPARPTTVASRHAPAGQDVGTAMTDHRIPRSAADALPVRGAGPTRSNGSGRSGRWAIRVEADRDAGSPSSRRPRTVAAGAPLTWRGRPGSC
jgi:hypothetical protein